MADGRWPMADGRWSMADGRWPMTDDRWPMADDRWPMADDRWPMTDDRWRLDACVGVDVDVAARAGASGGHALVDQHHDGDRERDPREAWGEEQQHRKQREQGSGHGDPQGNDPARRDPGHLRRESVRVGRCGITKVEPRRRLRCFDGRWPMADDRRSITDDRWSIT